MPNAPCNTVCKTYCPTGCELNLLFPCGEAFNRCMEGAEPEPTAASVDATTDVAKDDASAKFLALILHDPCFDKTRHAIGHDLAIWKAQQGGEVCKINKA